MTALNVLAEIRKAGLTITIIADDRLLVEPKSLITDAIRDQIRQYKADLIKLLSGVTVAADRAGNLKLAGDQVMVDKWLPTIRDHKVVLLESLSLAQHPAICRSCTRLEVVEILGKPVPGCFYRVEGDFSNGWRRIPAGNKGCIWS